MQLIMETILERDIDLILMRSFMQSSEFLHFFLSKVQKTHMKLLSVQHSFMTQDGESDITVILTDGSKRFALLIEDKINALAMPQQHHRYHLRGQQGILQKLYDDYAVFIVAPQAYLNQNTESKLYENRISYEELLYLFPEQSFERQLLQNAIVEKQTGYTPIEDSNVTVFWQHFYRYCAEHFPELSPYVYNGPRGTNAVWPTFRTGIKHTIIQHKSNHGQIDLEIAGYANYRHQFAQDNQHLLDPDMSLVQTGKSLSIRIKVPVIDFHQPFSLYRSDITRCLQSAMRLQKLSHSINLTIGEDKNDPVKPLSKR